MCSMKTPRNPYVDASMRELWQACQDRAGELMRPHNGTRTPEQRQALALDTAHLLLVLANEIKTGAFVANAPEKDLQNPGADFVAVFMRHHEDDGTGLRYRTLTRAADYVMGGERHHWLRTAELDGKKLYEVAIASDEGLRCALEVLAATRRVGR